MKRLNFLPKRHVTLWPDWSFIQVSDRTQNAFAACAAAIALLSIVAFLETQRIVQASLDQRRAAAHLAEVDRREANVRTIAQGLASLGTVARNVENARGISHRKIAEIARIGDLLPDGVWITDISQAPEQISLKGRARDAALLGAAMRSIEGDRTFVEPQLIAAREHQTAGSRYIDFELSIGLRKKG